MALSESLSLLQRRAQEAALGKITSGKTIADAAESVEEGDYKKIRTYLGVKHRKMNLTQVVQNNLNGKGPDKTGPEELRFHNIYPDLPGGGSVDLVVTTLTSYSPKNRFKNGLFGAIGSISFKGGKSTTFLFKFVDSYSGKRIILDEFFFSYYDIDNDKAELREQVSTPHFEKAWLANDTTIEVIPRQGSRPPIFRSTAIDNTGFNNPDDPYDLTPEQKRHAVTYSFRMKSGFQVTFATPNGTRKSGRNFFFSGAPVFPDCIKETKTEMMHIKDVAYSNFGGDGPDTFAPEGMRLKKVFELESGETVDLIVKTVGGPGFKYVPAIPEFNGARDGFGCINMQLGAKAKFQFDFVDSATNASLKMENLVFTWLDLDGHPHEQLESFQEKVIMGGPLGRIPAAWVSNGTEIIITDLSNNRTEFGSSAADRNGGADNPTDPDMLTTEQENRAFSVSLGSVKSFSAIIDLKSGRRKMPRSLYFQAIRAITDEEPEYCK